MAKQSVMNYDELDIDSERTYNVQLGSDEEGLPMLILDGHVRAYGPIVDGTSLEYDKGCHHERSRRTSYIQAPDRLELKLTPEAIDWLHETFGKETL